jgi:hypothetical protein
MFSRHGFPSPKPHGAKEKVVRSGLSPILVDGFVKPVEPLISTPLCVRNRIFTNIEKNVNAKSA